MADPDLSGLKIDKSAEARRPFGRRKRKAWMAAAAALVLLAALYFAGVLTPAIRIETAAVSLAYPSQAFTLLNASGYVVAQRKASVSSKATGRLEWLGVEEGSRVRRDQIIARLENRDVAATRGQAAANVKTARFNLESTRAELADAGKAFKRQKDLLSQGIVAQADYDVAEARLNKARATVAAAEAGVKSSESALANAEANLEYTLIRAPFDAVVLTKDADVGDIVTPLGAAANAKAAVVTIADLDSLEVEADVSESNLEKVKVGEPCEVQLDALPGVRFPAEVHVIVPTADRSKATVMVKVRFLQKDSRILPEMSAKVAFLSRPVKKEEEQPRVAVPPAAVVERDGRKEVFVVKGERVVEIPVQTGPPVGEMVEVVTGVKAGDKVAVKPLDKLKDGTKVKTAEK